MIAVVHSARCRGCCEPMSRKAQRLIAIRALALNCDEGVLSELMPRCSTCLRTALVRRAKGIPE